jgi:hypothetical protein
MGAGDSFEISIFSLPLSFPLRIRASKDAVSGEVGGLRARAGRAAPHKVHFVDPDPEHEEAEIWGEPLPKNWTGV